MRHHHHQVRVASEGRRVVAPRLTARLQRSPIGPTTNMIMNTLLVAKSPWKITVFTARCYASAVLAMALCLSVTSRSSTKTAKRRITQTTPHDTPKTLVF